MATRAAARKRGRGSGPRLNDLQRLEILRRHQDAAAPVSLRQLARDFGVDEKTIRRVVAAAADIEARASSSAVLRDRASVHRRPTPRFPALETALAAWIDARARAREEISPSIVMDKAKFLARGMGIPPEHFKASWGWYDKFSKRYGLQQAFIRGKEAAAASGTRRATQSLQELHQIMGSYDPEWVFSVEESTLFYDALPLGDYNGEQEAQKRNRVTLVLSCNSTGRVTLPICMGVAGSSDIRKLMENAPDIKEILKTTAFDWCFCLLQRS
ncbi:CENP-b protein 1 [Phytophthora cinnamomi]|uniref:CENP-b protein 1 n=1 Tax=Phytophthora cinnamomi TaxID=4785 RepID=UPI00355A0394|nr:CENP-b protein 1 [Phytophthora cinnamomi]